MKYHAPESRGKKYSFREWQLNGEELPESIHESAQGRFQGERCIGMDQGGLLECRGMQSDELSLTSLLAMVSLVVVSRGIKVQSVKEESIGGQLQHQFPPRRRCDRRGGAAGGTAACRTGLRCRCSNS